MSNSVCDKLATISPLCTHCREKEKLKGDVGNKNRVYFLFKKLLSMYNIKLLDSQVLFEILNILGFLCRLVPHLRQYTVV